METYDFESEKIEFKEIVNDKLVKEVIAFANTSGGRIFIGYDDKSHKAVGLENAENDLERATSIIHDSIEPDVSYLISAKIEKVDEKKVIIIDVLQGTDKPYYIKSKGMKPESVYIRVGSSSVPSSKEAIRNMIVQSSGMTFEKNISNNQNLTFVYADKFFNENEIEFGEKEKKSLNLINKQNLYTNLALLLSDQCPYTVKMAVYENNNKAVFKDSKETEKESIFKQLDDVVTYLNINNKVASVIQGMNRNDFYDYPIEVYREAILNFLRT